MDVQIQCWFEYRSGQMLSANHEINVYPFEVVGIARREDAKVCLPLGQKCG